MANLVQDLSPVTKGVVLLLSSYILYQTVKYLIQVRRHGSFIRKHGCKPLPTYPHRDPILGLDLFLENGKLSKTGGFWDRLIERYLSQDAWTFSQLTTGTRIINTAEPENIKAMLATQFHEFELPPRRKEVRVFYFLFRTCLLTSSEASAYVLVPGFTELY
jgi:hypothetical protein